MTDATFFGVEDEEDTSAAVSEPVFFGSSDEEDTSAVGDSPETVAFDEDTPPEDLPTPGEDGKPLPRQQGESPVPLVSKDEARAKGEMGITEAARNDYAAATGADAPDNPVLAQVANMGLSVGGRLNANLQMKAAQRLMSDEELSDGEMDSAFDAMQFGVAAPFAAAGRAIAGGFRSRPSAILHEWDETEGRRIADPGERGRARRAYAAQIASDFVKERTAVKQNARTESAARERTHGANIVTGGLAQLGYTAPYILGPAGIAAQFLEEGAANAVGYANDEYGYDDKGRFRLAAKGDDAGRAALAGFGTAGIETAAEVALGRLGGAVVKRGGKMFLAGAGGILSKVPFAREIGGKVAATRVGKAVGAFAGGMSNAFKWTNRKLHLGGFGEENLEEYEGAVLNALTGWDRRASELVDDKGNPTTALSRFVDANKEFFSPENMLELNEAMLITMGGGLFVAKCAQRRALRNVDNLIRENHLMSEEELGKAGLEAKAAALDSYLDNLTEAETVERLDRANGWLGRFTDAIAGDKGKFAQEVADLRRRMDEHHDRMMGEELDRLKVPRQQFSIPTRTDADGKTVPDFKTIAQTDTKTGKSGTYRGVVDADSGITLTENGVSGASAYTVHSPDGRKSQDFATLDEAVEAATRMKNELALDRARDELKRQYVADTVKSQFKGATVVDVKTAEEAVKAGVEIAGVDVSQNKDYDPSRRAWKLPDGTVVLVRDNLHGPAEVETVLRHEIVGHGEAAMDDEFMNAAERGNEGVRTRKAYGVQMGAGAERALREAVANTIQRRSHHADSVDKLVHGVRNALRRMGVDLKMNDADFETEVARMEREIREGGYGLHESKPMESGSAFSEAAQNETAQDTPAQEAGKSAEQTTQDAAQPAEQTAQEAAQEAAQPAEAPAQETAQPAENAAQEATAPMQPEEAATPTPTPERRQGDVAEKPTPAPEKPSEKPVPAKRVQKNGTHSPEKPNAEDAGGGRYLADGITLTLDEWKRRTGESDVGYTNSYKMRVPTSCDRQGNPLAEDGSLALDGVDDVGEIADGDFTAPTRNVCLPALPKNVDAAIGANGKPVVIKRNIFEKNYTHHPELTPAASREILKRALYNPNLVGQSQPVTKSNYMVAIQTGDGNAVTILDVSQSKDGIEVVGWRNVDEKGLERLKRQAEREGGQFLILRPSEEGQPAALSGRPNGLTGKNVPQAAAGVKTDNGESKVTVAENATTTPTSPESSTPERPKEYADWLAKYKLADTDGRFAEWQKKQDDIRKTRDGRQEEKKPESADFSVSRIFAIDDYGEIHEGRIVPEVRKGGKTRVEYGGRSRLFPMRNLFTTRERAENALAERRRIADVFRAAENAPAAAPKESEATAPAKAAKPAERKEGASAKPSPKTPSVKMKDEAAERLAQRQEDELAALFDSPELDADGTIVSGDEVRKTMPGYDRLDWSTHVDRTGYVGPRLEAQFQRLLKERKGKGDGTVVFLAGGNGAGKSTVAAKLGTPDFTIDSTLGNPDVAKRQIDSILANGQTPVIHFVYRAPGQALEGIKNRVKNGGHIVSPLSFANSHVKSRENLRLLSEAYGDKLPIHIYDNSVAGAPEITLEQLEAKRKPDHAKLREEANYYLGHLRDREKAVRDSQGGLAGSGAKGPSGQVDFDSPEFDPDVFQKRVGAVAKLVKTYKESGVADFGTLATRMAERFPEKFGAMKPYLRGVWNAVAEQMGLDEVSKKDADGIYSDIEKAHNTHQSEEDYNERLSMEQSRQSDGGQHPSSDGVSPKGGDGSAQNEETGENGSGTGETGTDPTVLHGRAGGQALSVERPEMADGALPAGRAEGVGEGAKGSAAVDVDDGRAATADRRGAQRGESRVQLESGRQDNLGRGSGARETGADESARGLASPVRDALTQEAPNAVKNENYIVTDADERAIENGSVRDKVRQNVDAVRIVRKLSEDGRDATPDEKTKLARYVGWGGLKPIFNNAYRNAYEREQSEGTLPPQTWTAIRKTPLGEEGYDLYKQLRELLSTDEMSSAEQSTLNAFFTPIRLCRSIHKALAAAGLKGGKFLETSAGIGNLIGTGDYVNPRWTAVEIDKVSGQILKALYPKAHVQVSGFEDVLIPDNFMDAVVSNVPFGNTHPFDPNYKKHGFVIHDFFFAKSVDKLHPGGVAALVTDPGTLDKKDKKLIRYLSEHGGKIVGAVRLPNGFFTKNAGTDVATDVVFIQKVGGRADNGAFMHTEERRGCAVSGWFVDHPELCLGDMQVGSSQYGPKMYYRAKAGVSDADMDAAIAKAAEGLAYKSVNEAEAPKKAIVDADANGLQNGNVGVVGGKIVRRENGELLEVPQAQIPKLTAQLRRRLVTPQEIVQGLGRLREAFRAVIDGQLADCSDEELKKLQAALSREYATFTSRYGELNSQLVRKFVDLDYAAAPLLLGMENVKTIEDGVDSKGNKKTHKEYSRADIFTKRTIFARPRATRADSALDGLRISLNETGTVNTARISELTGRPEEDVRKELIESGRVFVNPESSGLETRDEYLSGSVRRKLKAARAAAEIDGSFRRNVDALEKVQPEDVAATDISYQLGQNWIPTDVYEQFFREVVFQGTSPRLRVSFDQRRHLWEVDSRNQGTTEYDEESGLPVEDLLERTMNGRSIVVKVQTPTGETAVDQAATTATKIVQEKIARSFQSWMTDDIDRANRIERVYNDTMNDNVMRDFDVDVLEFCGLSKDWAERVGTKGREYQRRCVSRGTFGGNLLIAHCVGAGKTFEMASICMQLRRLGIARKPLFAVPNHMLSQWNREFHEAYPGAKVLVATKKDLAKANRRAFLARAANGDWDCIIVAHSSFSRIAMSPEHQAEYIEAEIADLQDLLHQVQGQKDQNNVKKQIQSRKDKLRSLLDPSRKDDSVKFEELGCDYLFVDEAHNFKGLDIHTHMSNVPGVAGSVSQRAQDLEMKCRYVTKLHGGDKGVVFATGTPISNSVGEMYVMMRYLAPSKMDEMGVKSFDDWARQFGQVVNEWSPNPSGVGFREKARFSQFQNVPEMKKFFRSFADIVLDSELQIRRPRMIGGKPIQHVIKPSAAQVAYVQALNRRMERMQTSKVDPRTDNMLKVTTEGRLLAIDPMLIGVKDESHRRANVCADEVKRIYDQSTGKTVTGRDGRPRQINGTQLVFCDSGVPKKKQFRQLVRTADGTYETAIGKAVLRVHKPDADGNRFYEILRGDTGERVWAPHKGVSDHSADGIEDLASVYTALENMQSVLAGLTNQEAAQSNSMAQDMKGWKNAPKPKGTPVDINAWIDDNIGRIGYDPRLANPYAERRAEVGETDDAETDDDRDMSEEANGDAEVDGMLRGKFNMYAELRNQLIRRGIPANEIAFIHDAETMTQKQALFDKVKRGEIRILIGNTAKMGEGTNVQDLLVAIHHLDIPWKPAWMTQRDGRGIRSGNLNEEVGIHTYITEGTFDVYSWDTVGRKAKFIENAMNSRMDQRVIEDVDTTVMSLEEGKAAAAGDPRILERVKLMKAIEKARMEFETQVKASARAALRVRTAERDLMEVERRVSSEREAIEKYNKAKGDKPFTWTTVDENHRELTDNETITHCIQDRLGFFAAKGTDVGLVGQLFGFDVRYERGVGANRGAYMTIMELGIKFPVTVFQGIGAAFPQSDLSKFKSEITRSTGAKAVEFLDKQVGDSQKRLAVAQKAAENAAGFDRESARKGLGEMNVTLARLNEALGINDTNVRNMADTFLKEQGLPPLSPETQEAADGREAAPGTPEVEFDSPELNAIDGDETVRDDRQLQEIYDIISDHTPEVAAKRLSGILQEIKDGRRRIRPYRAEEIVRGAQGRNHALGVLALAARATGESLGRNAYGGKTEWRPQGAGLQETRQRNALVKIAKGLGVYVDSDRLDAIVSDEGRVLGRGRNSTAFSDETDDHVVKVREIRAVADDVEMPVEGGATWDFDDLLLSNAILGKDFDTTLIGVSENNGRLYLILRQPKADDIPTNRSVLGDLRDYMTGKGFSSDEFARDRFENADYEVTDLRLGANIGTRNGKIFPFDPIASFSYERRRKEQVLFDSPELDSAAGRLGITKENLNQQARNLGRVPWRPKKRTWAEVYQRAEAMRNQTGFIEDLVADAARYARPLSAEQTLAVGPHLLALGKQYEEIRQIRMDAEHLLLEAQREGAGTEELASLQKRIAEIRKEEAEISKRHALAFKAMRMSKAEQGRSLAANRALYSEEFDFLGMKETRQSVLGRELTPEELRRLHDICDRARDLDEDARSELWAAVHAQAERTIKELFTRDAVRKSGTPRRTKLADYRKKYLDAMMHLKVHADTVGGSLVGITGDEYGTWNRPLFDLLLWHRFETPGITASDALAAVTEDVNTYIKADETTVARILTGFERSWDINRHDNVLKGGRDLRSQILTQLQIETLLNGRMPGKTGPVQGEPSQELRDIRHTRDVLKNDLEEETGDPRKLQSRQKRWMKWYDNRIEDLKREIAAGERLPQTKRTLTWTVEMKQKRAEYEELVAERDRVCGKSCLSEEERIKRYEATLERTLRRAVDRLQAAKDDDFRKPVGATPVTSEYIESLKQAIADTNAEWRQEKRDRLMFGRTQAEINRLNENRMKTRERRISYWQSLTAPNADRSVVKKPQIPMSAEQQSQYDELGRQMKRLRRQVMDMRAHDELMKMPWPVRHGVEYLRFVNGLTRGLLATGDHSAILRQMAQLSLGHPRLAAQAFKNTIGTAFSDEAAMRINSELLADPRIKEAVDKGWLNWRNVEAEGNSGDVEMFSSLHSAAITVGRKADGTERRFALDDVKFVASILRGSERIYASYINSLSAEIYLALTNADGFTARLLFGQNGLTDYTKKEIAARINMANGSAQIDSGKKKQMMNQLTGIFWAPKLALSRLQLAIGWDVIHPLLDSGTDVKTRFRTAGFNAIEHARAKLAMIALGTLMMMLAGDDDDKEKLRRSSWFKRFLQVIKPRIGNTTLDFSGGEVGWYQLIAKWATLEKETGAGKTQYLAAKDGHKQSFGADAVNETFRFAQGKFNPLLSNTIALWTGKDYTGQPFGLGELAVNTFVPLGASDVVNAFVENGLGRGLLLAPFITFGAGGNTYSPKRHEIAVNQFTEAVKAYDAVRNNRELESDEKSDLIEELEDDFPELSARGRIEGKIKAVKFFESEIRKVQKLGVAVPQSLTDGLERAKKETLDLIRASRQSVDDDR